MPQNVAGTYIRELQDCLMDDDCYLPHFKRAAVHPTRGRGKRHGAQHVSQSPEALPPSYVPQTVLKAFRITAKLADGNERVIAQESANHHRLWRCWVEVEDCVSLTLEPLETWGAETVRIFAFEAE